LYETSFTVSIVLRTIGRLQDIVSECNSANCFSVIADETTDVSTTEQISLCVRYVSVDSDEEISVKESFLGFAEASSTTGEELTTTIMAKLREYGIETPFSDSEYLNH
jgi:hypothetical protein